jgi:hypothetical protein
MRSLNTKWSIAGLVVGLSLSSLVGCERHKTPAEKAGDKIENATDKAGDKVEDLGDKTEDKLDKH